MDAAAFKGRVSRGAKQQSTFLNSAPFFYRVPRFFIECPVFL
jgi:hypothetical protein